MVPPRDSETLDFCEQSLAMRKDDEDVFVRRITGCGINKGIGNVGVVHVKVATKDAPQDTLKCR
jgi:hypothetical protein